MAARIERQDLLGRIGRLVHPIGFLLAGLAFGAALTPSLLPRDPLMQGLLAGGVAAVAYEIGGFLDWLWRFLGLPRPPRAWQVGTGLCCAGLALGTAALCLSWAAGWQNATRAVSGLEPVDTSFPLTIALIGVTVFLVLWGLFRLFGLVWRWADRQLDRVLPPRIARVVGLGIALWLFWALGDGLLIQWAFRVADASFEAADNFIEPDIAQPLDPLKSGSAASLIDWQEMGRWGRSFVANAPSQAEIAAFAGPQAKDPVRVYVGRRSADTEQERADLALQELIRVGGFDRSALVVAVPVGTGWMDPGAHDTLDFMLGGDVATVGVQYSYLTSVLSLLAHPEYGVDQSRALFDTIYAYWTRLPRDHRPKLYLFGLSQGAFNSQATLPLLDLFGDPINGALWAGSPFFSRFWSAVRDRRQPDSPAWRPRYGNGSLVRVMTQDGADPSYADMPWGPTRLVFLNYGSDPIVAFTTAVGVHPPAWLDKPRAPDVPPELRWYPIVTMFQLALDSAISLDVPRHGHNYVAEDYIGAWAEVLAPEDWSAERAAELKAIFAKRGPAF
ncbi:MAG: alpha/beta-hydrolase family protein [Amaricoccus sp.]